MQMVAPGRSDPPKSLEPSRLTKFTWVLLESDQQELLLLDYHPHRHRALWTNAQGVSWELLLLVVELPLAYIPLVPSIVLNNLQVNA